MVFKLLEDTFPIPKIEIKHFRLGHFKQIPHMRMPKIKFANFYLRIAS